MFTTLIKYVNRSEYPSDQYNACDGHWQCHILPGNCTTTATTATNAAAATITTASTNNNNSIATTRRNSCYKTFPTPIYCKYVNGHGVSIIGNTH